MKHSPFLLRSVILSVIASLIFTFSAQAQKRAIDINELINETQLMSEDQNLMRLVWYIPLEYWEASFAADESISADELEEMIDIFDDFELIAVIDGEFGVFGNIKYTPISEVRAMIRLETSDGKKHLPLDDSEISNDASTLMSFMQPMLANMMGDMGKNMQFFMFKSKGKEDRLIDPFKQHSFKVHLGDEVFSFELPLASLLPPKYCPTDGKKMKGTWIYCPFHGVELTDKN
ncbi:hypothetical protein [Roseivirga sp. UBA838]|uniref:hypothetical protein n=1 Tax=Roseivirga sp. UBA838 TaxID=1947393 RepID=UPI00257F7B84|nr:hypothetical protein [Roseivirga sp. UBA838]|tara:strand:- start:9440 stop:10135 length:696 start_codon:yes stop_codon:yes gene_type:complete